MQVKVHEQQVCSKTEDGALIVSDLYRITSEHDDLFPFEPTQGAVTTTVRIQDHRLIVRKELHVHCEESDEFQLTAAMKALLVADNDKDTAPGMMLTLTIALLKAAEYEQVRDNGKE